MQSVRTVKENLALQMIFIDMYPLEKQIENPDKFHDVQSTTKGQSYQTTKFIQF